MLLSLVMAVLIFLTPLPTGLQLGLCYGSALFIGLAVYADRHVAKKKGTTV